MATKKEIEERAENERTFSGLFKNGEETPESIMAKVMWGQDTIMHRGKQQRITKSMVTAAQALLPYRLPRLNSIDAVQVNVDVTQDEWAKMLADEEAQNDG
ncbi:MAG TPA: hypothetical protein VJM50_21210 [Pyrinomonadaceae bacterium]|nr:hypothetical protein [Pyrinomonadaceae bacterium]